LQIGMKLLGLAAKSEYDGSARTGLLETHHGPKKDGQS
jgi:hypothetical protein